GPGHEGVEVLHGAQIGVDSVMAAGRGADRVGRSGVPGLCLQAVVAALAERGADGMDRCQVGDVEAQDRKSVVEGKRVEAGRHTRSKRDWSSDVCSSDLARATKASKSSMVPRSGWIASWPPAGEPIA